jgi:hypothetical protein
MSRKLGILGWKEEGLGKELVSLGVDLLHFHEIASEVLLPMEFVHAREMIYSLVRSHALEATRIDCAVLPKEVPLRHFAGRGRALRFEVWDKSTRHFETEGPNAFFDNFILSAGHVNNYSRSRLPDFADRPFSSWDPPRRPLVRARGLVGAAFGRTRRERGGVIQVFWIKVAVLEPRDGVALMPETVALPEDALRHRSERQ